MGIGISIFLLAVGAIITFASLGVTLAGAWMTIAGLGNLDNDTGGSFPLSLAGMVVSAIGDGGVFIGGPITWMAGIGRASE